VTAIIRSLDLIRELVGFPTVSRDPNRELLHHVQSFLARHGIKSEILWNAEKTKGNLWASVGPADRPGVILSGHTDVVPIDGQTWTSNPFTLRGEGGKLFGRGSADMKSFIAIALAFAPEMVRRRLQAPIHFALSYDEEVGCMGVHSLVDRIASLSVKPALCIVGEPTSMQVIVGHKGGRSYRVRVTGLAAHSSLTPRAVNAIDYAAELILYLRDIADEWIKTERRDADFDVPHSTISTGLISGGAAINIVPENCEFVFEFRHLAGLDADALMAQIQRFITEKLEPRMKAIAPEAGFLFTPIYQYPGLGIEPEHAAVTFVKQLVGRNDHAKVAFGTEAGLFHGRAGVAAVVCGPGSIQQAHKPDEFIELSQVAQCEAFIARMIDRLEQQPLAF
jgi:acetylornithine deacetylase